MGGATLPSWRAECLRQDACSGHGSEGGLPVLQDSMGGHCSSLQSAPAQGSLPGQHHGLQACTLAIGPCHTCASSSASEAHHIVLAVA